jgi:hypothetical protein
MEHPKADNPMTPKSITNDIVAATPQNNLPLLQMQNTEKMQYDINPHQVKCKRCL